MQSELNISNLASNSDTLEERAFSMYKELGAYEYLWTTAGTSFKSLAEKFSQNPKARPSDFVQDIDGLKLAKTTHQILKKANGTSYGIRVLGETEYPESLHDAKHPVHLLYYQGWWDLIHAPKRIAIVGTRNPTQQGMARTKRLVSNLVKDGFVIVSGLAKGIDTIAHKTTIDNGGQTIAVIGTPLNQAYPAENAILQQRIARDYLLVSAVPVSRYTDVKDPRQNRHFFPERNKVMSALSHASLIVEAGETSGTLTQARATLAQGRKLFILNSCFENPKITWPAKFEKQGAVRVRDYEDIKNALATDNNNKN